MGVLSLVLAACPLVLHPPSPATSRPRVLFFPDGYMPCSSAGECMCDCGDSHPRKAAFDVAPRPRLDFNAEIVAALDDL
jgi:hypothetical protein